jgi:integral membrane protein
MRNLVKFYTGFKPFTEEEAWLLFKLAAFAEAIGWTLLIIGICLTNYVFHSRVPVVLAGRTHGILFSIYIMAVLTLAPSLGWKWKRTIIAGLFSVPPYGTLLFELWASHTRQKQSFVHLSRVISYQVLVH